MTPDSVSGVFAQLSILVTLRDGLTVAVPRNMDVVFTDGTIRHLHELQTGDKVTFKQATDGHVIAITAERGGT